MTGDVRTEHGRLTVAVEIELFQRMAEAAILGREWDFQDATEGLISGNRQHDEIAAAVMDAAPAGTPYGDWGVLLESMSSFVNVYQGLKRLHGPQAFRAVLKAFLDNAEYTRPILDDAEREALGLAGALNGGSQHAA